MNPIIYLTLEQLQWSMLDIALAYKMIHKSDYAEKEHYKLKNGKVVQQINDINRAAIIIKGISIVSRFPFIILIQSLYIQHSTLFRSMHEIPHISIICHSVCKFINIHQPITNFASPSHLTTFRSTSQFYFFEPNTPLQKNSQKKHIPTW